MHPGDPQATALLLDAELFQELYRLDLLDTTFYANDGFLTGHHATSEDPAARTRILGLADEAIHEADVRIQKNPNDIDALYARGWARSLKCTYIAMVERGFAGGLKLAIKAKDAPPEVVCRVVARRNGEEGERAFNVICPDATLRAKIEELRGKGDKPALVGVVSEAGITVTKVN